MITNTSNTYNTIRDDESIKKEIFQNRAQVDISTNKITSFIAETNTNINANSIIIQGNQRDLSMKLDEAINVKNNLLEQKIRLEYERVSESRATGQQLHALQLTNTNDNNVIIILAIALLGIFSFKK